MSTTQMTVEPGSHALQLTREFDAPAALLLRAHTEPELLAQWLGPRRLHDPVRPARGAGRRPLPLRPVGRGRHRARVPRRLPRRPLGRGRHPADLRVRGHARSRVLPDAALRGARRPDHPAGHHRLRHRRGPGRDDRAGMETGAEEGFAKLDELLARLAPVH